MSHTSSAPTTPVTIGMSLTGIPKEISALAPRPLPLPVPKPTPAPAPTPEPVPAAAAAWRSA